MRTPAIGVLIASLDRWQVRGRLFLVGGMFQPIMRALERVLSRMNLSLSRLLSRDPTGLLIRKSLKENFLLSENKPIKKFGIRARAMMAIVPVYFT